MSENQIVTFNFPTYSSPPSLHQSNYTKMMLDVLASEAAKKQRMESPSKESKLPYAVNVRVSAPPSPNVTCSDPVVVSNVWLTRDEENVAYWKNALREHICLLHAKLYTLEHDFDQFILHHDRLRTIRNEISLYIHATELSDIKAKLGLVFAYYEETTQLLNQLSRQRKQPRELYKMKACEIIDLS